MLLTGACLVIPAMTQTWQGKQRDRPLYTVAMGWRTVVPASYVLDLGRRTSSAWCQSPRTSSPEDATARCDSGPSGDAVVSRAALAALTLIALVLIVGISAYDVFRLYA